jgi:lipoprotein signal peptidase
MTRNGLTGLGAAAGLIVLAADQGSKWWVLHVLDLPSLGQVALLPMLNLTMVWNPGVTFGLLRADSWWGSLLLAAVAIGVVIALGFWLRRAESRMAAVSIGAIAGGAIGNVIDRVRYGAVVDFIHFYIPTTSGEWSWYVFNVADASIVCGVAALVIETQWPKRRVPAGEGTHPAG